MTITVAQSTGASADNATSIAKATTSNVTAGNRLIILVGKYSPSSDVIVVGDISKSAGTCTLGSFALDKVITGTTNYFYAAIFSAEITGSGSCTITVGGGPAGSYWNIALIEMASSLGVPTLENTNGAAANTGAPDSGNVTSAGAALFVGSLTTDITSATTHTIDAAYSLVFEQEDGLNHLGGAFGYRIVSTGTTDSASWTAPTTQEYSIALAVYQEPATAVTGTLAKTLATITSSTAGTVSVTGSFAKTLNLTSTTSATVDITALVSQTLAALTISGAGNVTVTASLASTLATILLSSGAIVDVNGALGQTLSSITSSTSGGVDISGALGIVFSALQSTSASSVDVTGTLTGLLSSIVISAGGDVTITGSLLQTLGVLILSAAGSASNPGEVLGTLAQTLSAVTITATGSVDVGGIIQTVLSSLTISGSGVVSVEATALQTLGAITSQSAGSVSVTGTLNQVLSVLLLVASGLGSTGGFSAGGLVEVAIRRNYKAKDEVYEATIRRKLH